MTQIVSILFFLGLLAGCVQLIAAMLGNDWTRIVAALEGREITANPAFSPRRGVNFVDFTPDRARVLSPLRAAA